MNTQGIDGVATVRNPVNEQMTVNEIVQMYPETLSVFQRFGIDSCCGGPLPLAEAASRHGHDVSALMHALQAVLRLS